MPERETMSESPSVRVLSVMAHPDDEVIFGWPVFQNPRIEKSLIMLVSDRDNSERQWCARRLEPLSQICEQTNCRLTCLDLNSEFYRTPYRRADLVVNDIYRQVTDAVRVELDSFSPDFVFCHNPMGEYGMFDHRILFDIVYHHSSANNVIITDLCESHDGWPSGDSIPPRMQSLYYENCPSVAVELDAAFYERGRQTYDQFECWTWKKKGPPDYPPRMCRMFLLKDTIASEAAISKLSQLASPNER